MKRPMVYYASSTFTGCLCALMLFQNAVIGAVVAASFFAIFFFTIDKKFLIINIFFFLIGVLSFNIYFNIRIPRHLEVRIISKKGYYYVL
jgi:competence protein ComEC